MNLILFFFMVVTVFSVIAAVVTQLKSNRRLETFYTRDMQWFEQQNDIVNNLEEYSNAQDEILFLLTDLMHNHEVNLSNDEISELFLEARMLTKHYIGSSVAKEDLLKFIEKLNKLVQTNTCKEQP